MAIKTTLYHLDVELVNLSEVDRTGMFEALDRIKIREDIVKVADQGEYLAVFTPDDVCYILQDGTTAWESQNS